MRRAALLLVWACACCLLLGRTPGLTAAQDARVSIRVDADRRKGPMTPMWAFFGYDEPNYTYMADGRRLLSELAALSPVPVFVRTHNLLTTGDGRPALKWGSTNAYTEDERGRPKYDWTIVDRIFDTLVERKMKPLVEIGFMPKALSTRPEPYQHDWAPGLDYGRIYTGWAYHPNDYDKWRELVYQWVRHAVDRYGQAEVESWYWEVWNEPDIGYWRGTPEQFQKLYDYAADGLKRALPTARIGGPHVTGPNGTRTQQILRNFIEHCLRGTSYATGSVKTNPENAYRNGTMYSSYTAAQIARTYELADLHKVNLRGSVTWAFEFEGQPWFAGFRDLATNGAAPIEAIRDAGVRGAPDVYAIATRQDREIAVLVWSYHDDDLPGEPAEIVLTLENVPAGRPAVSHYRVDATHANAYETWKQMGSPEAPTPAQRAILEKAGQLAIVAPPEVTSREGSASVRLTLGRQGVALLTFTYR